MFHLTFLGLPPSDSTPQPAAGGHGPLRLTLHTRRDPAPPRRVPTEPCVRESGLFSEHPPFFRPFVFWTPATHREVGAG